MVVVVTSKRVVVEDAGREKAGRVMVVLRPLVRVTIVD